ncbi:MAG: ABC transporter permease [Planctomycetes bacterium]|nr:ABC transporter permease [Planctomycetota bacterium]
MHLLFRPRTWYLGFKHLALHPMRSLLTVLGIFIGVASVIWLLAIGEGISLKAQEQIAGLGAENIIVRSLQPTSDKSSGNLTVVPYGITRRDFERMTETIPSVRQGIPIRELRRRFSYSDHELDGRLVGCSAEYAELNHLEVSRGRFLSDADVQRRATVCVLAAETAEKLFPYEDPLGRSIHVDQDYYSVVGVLEHRNATAGIGGSLDSQDFSSDVYIPVSTLWQRIGDMVTTYRSGSRVSEIVELSQVTLRLRTVEDVLPTAQAVRELLSHHHRSSDFAVVVPLELLEQAERTRLMFMVLMGLIAAISLVVGGIGIMNIMLATVTERTREIGIRRALGAKKRDIVGQFLAETMLLSAAGGLTGVLAGLSCTPVVIGLRYLVANLFPRMLANAPEIVQTIEPTIVMWSIPVAFGIAVLIGVMFGLYPARRAASMDPIVALRHVA